MDTDSRAPRTAAGRQMLDNHIYWGEWYQHNWLAAILAIEDEAQRPPWTDQQAIAAVMERESQAYEQGRAEAAADPVAGEALLDFDAMRVVRGWPTPNHMRRTADALDVLVIPRYGDVLRWFADRCDENIWHIGAEKAKERLARALPTPAPEEGERDE